MTISPGTLTGRIVELVPYEESMREQLVEAMLESPEIFRFIPVRMSTREDIEARFQLGLDTTRSRAGTFYATRLVSSGEIVGGTSSVVTDRSHRRLEIGFTWLLPRAQRTAANTEAKYLQLTQAFERDGFVRVELKTDARNAGSRAAILRIGAREEGVLRSHMICWDGHRRDSVYFSILDTEWPSVKTRLEALLERSPS